MKNSLVLENKQKSKYFGRDEKNNFKSTDINILLNSVKINQKKEKRKKILFSVSASLGLILFGIILF